MELIDIIKETYKPISFWIIKRYDKKNTSLIYIFENFKSNKENFKLFKNFIEKYKIENYISLEFEEEQIYISSNEEFKKINIEELKKYFLKLTNSRYKPKKINIINNENSKFYNFFLNNMGGGYNLIKIDYYINEINTFIKYKEFNYINDKFYIKPQNFSLLKDTPFINNILFLIKNKKENIFYGKFLKKYLKLEKIENKNFFKLDLIKIKKIGKIKIN